MFGDSYMSIVSGDTGWMVVSPFGATCIWGHWLDGGLSTVPTVPWGIGTPDLVTDCQGTAGTADSPPPSSQCPQTQVAPQEIPPSIQCPQTQVMVVSPVELPVSEDTSWMVVSPVELLVSGDTGWMVVSPVELPVSGDTGWMVDYLRSLDSLLLSLGSGCSEDFLSDRPIWMEKENHLRGQKLIHKKVLSHRRDLSHRLDQKKRENWVGLQESWGPVRKKKTVDLDTGCQELLAGACLDGSGLGQTIRNPGGGELTGGAEGRAPWEQLGEKSP
ncbi:hypothetical protein F0562_024079 [Nyssa sinensis]|uniref:Uncharacterized protein n=1 Tax=Nyssa sinensis TaxID=561372 RepID=A0A5J5BMD5_9ASTE|nr:hypothetical protein F0562_024079 [Nyssa sinensis]